MTRPHQTRTQNEYAHCKHAIVCLCLRMYMCVCDCVCAMPEKKTMGEHHIHCPHLSALLSGAQASSHLVLDTYAPLQDFPNILLVEKLEGGQQVKNTLPAIIATASIILSFKLWNGHQVMPSPCIAHLDRYAIGGAWGCPRRYIKCRVSFSSQS